MSTIEGPQTVESTEPAETGQPASAADASEDARSNNREAAQQRHRRREAEAARDAALAERDALAERLVQAQRMEAERVAGEVLADGSDLFLLAAVDLNDLLTSEGWVDKRAVVATAQEIVTVRGDRFARRRTTRTSPDGGPRESVPRQRSLGELLQAQYAAQRDHG